MKQIITDIKGKIDALLILIYRSLSQKTINVTEILNDKIEQSDLIDVFHEYTYVFSMLFFFYCSGFCHTLK